MSIWRLISNMSLRPKVVALVGVWVTTGLLGQAHASGSSTLFPASPTGVEAAWGDARKGFMTLPIYRAGAVPDEFLVLKTPGNCQRSVQVTMAWDEAQNYVRIRVQGKGVLERLPSVNRTEGVDFFPNRFWPEPEDFDNGQYLLWFISSPFVATFYYDVATFDLLGSEYDFATPPVPSIPVELPVFTAIPTPFFQPDENGDVDVTWEYAYDAMVRPDLPNQAHALGSFIPHTLCKADPYRYDSNIDPALRERTTRIGGSELARIFGERNYLRSHGGAAELLHVSAGLDERGGVSGIGGDFRQYPEGMAARLREFLRVHCAAHSAAADGAISRSVLRELV